VSKVEPGGKSSVGGIKPFEIITHVNDQPVATVKDFEKLISGGQELRFAVKRMTKGRVVRIKLDGSAAGPATKESPVFSAVKGLLTGNTATDPNRP
jgi:S1-C subfamily serine protease